MNKNRLSSRRTGERGQTLILVAVAIVSLLGMAALAIDVVTLYVARTEVQRAADAAALAGAKAIADSGITTLDAASSATNQAGAEATATAMITQVIAQNLVSGGAPALVGAPNYNFAQPNDPIVTVTVQKTSLPVFFAKIWGQTAATVSASASAEAYSPTGMATYTPIAPKCVKPWLIANSHLGATTGNYVNAGGIADASTLGQTFLVSSACPGASAPNCGFSGTLAANNYLPALVTANATNICPTCKGATNFEQSVECCDANPYSCGAATATWDNSVNPDVANGVTQLGGQCLIHQTGAPPGIGQDTLVVPSPYPPGPVQIRAQSGPQNGNLVTTSHSIVTVPVIDNTLPFPPLGGPVNVVGFMQAFLNYVGSSGQINITVLNIAGCSASSNGAAPIVGGSGSSPVAVRLVTALTPQ